jgi:hypothetical protein
VEGRRIADRSEMQAVGWIGRKRDFLQGKNYVNIF